MKTNAIIIMDGFGDAKPTKGNAVTLAKTPNLNRLFANYAHAELAASGLAVGLPNGQMGNSEVGHLNLGAGRIVYQDITAIDKSIADGDFFQNPALVDAINGAKKSNGYLHLLGLASDGGVHSHINHLFALLDLCKRESFNRVWVHVITDGRDTDPKSGATFIAQIEKKIKSTGVGKIASVSGRYYAMDRDNRWERIALAFEAIVGGEGEPFNTATKCINTNYQHDVTDEFVIPASIGNYIGFKREDTVIFFNFRADRARQLTQKLIELKIPLVTMTQYDAKLHTQIAFPPRNLANTLGEVLAKNHLTQIRMAETEKYAHVTYYFNGGIETPNKGEARVLIPSPKVATYDLAPQMSALELTDRAIAELGKHNVLILNFANCDMVGHTGVIPAAITAVETVDACVGRLVDAIVKNGGSAILTADHGNAEQMLTPSGTPFTAHTTNPVPVLLAGANFENPKSPTVHNGALCDVAPTLLKILGLPQPKEMTGAPLF